MPESEWKLPFNFAIGIHLLFIVGAIYLPGLFDKKPKFADIYTVSLINVAEPAPHQEVAPQPETQHEPAIQPPKTAPVKAKKTAPIAEPVATPKPAPQKAISIKPLKRKKVKKNLVKPEDTRAKELARKKRQKLAEALRDEQIAKDNAKQAQEALERERNLIKNPASVASPTGPSSNQPTMGQKTIGGSSNLITSRFYANITGRLQQFWSLPEYMQKNSDMTAIVVITVSKNGQIADKFFESRSGDRVFDQFVVKTIEAANPLPPIPAAMKKQRYEIGLVFTPEGIRR